MSKKFTCIVRVTISTCGVCDWKIRTGDGVYRCSILDLEEAIKEIDNVVDYGSRPDWCPFAVGKDLYSMNMEIIKQGEQS